MKLCKRKNEEREGEERRCGYYLTGIFDRCSMRDMSRSKEGSGRLCLFFSSLFFSTCANRRLCAVACHYVDTARHFPLGIWICLVPNGWATCIRQSSRQTWSAHPAPALVARGANVGAPPCRLDDNYGTAVIKLSSPSLHLTQPRVSLRQLYWDRHRCMCMCCLQTIMKSWTDY